MKRQKELKKVRKVEKPSVFKLKKKLWTIFSQYVRLRDADLNGNVKCCTCDAVYFWTDPKGRLQGGHFFPQRGNAALIFDESNVHGQCSRCNGAQEGEQYLYSLFIIEKYGQQELDRLVKLKGQPFKYTIEFLEDKIKHYTKEVDKLKKSKNL